MAYQLFVKGKEVTPVQSSIITSTSQWAIPSGDQSTLTGLSNTGFTLTNNFSSNIAMRVNLSLTNLVVGQIYTLVFTGTSTPAGGYIGVTYYLYGNSNPDNQTFNDFATSVYTQTQEFTAVESSAIIEFRSYNGAVGNVFAGTNISVITASQGFNGLYELDVLKGSPFTLDFNFKDIKDLKTKGSHSYNFRLPSTPSNDQFFGSYYKVGSYYSEDNFSFNPFGMASCYVLKDTIEVFSGNMQLTNVYLKDKNRYEYECILFSSEVSFLDTIKGTKFKELNYTEWNHTLTPTAVYNSYNSNSIDGGNIVWSLWDYGIGHASSSYMSFFQQPVTGFLDWSSFSFNINKLRPQVRLKALIDKVFAITGYTYKSDLFASAEFAKIYMDLNYNKADNITTEVVVDAYNTQVANNSSQTIGNYFPFTSQRHITFPNEISDESTQWNSSQNYWLPQAIGTYELTISGTCTPSGTPPNTGDVLAFQIGRWNWANQSNNTITIDQTEWFEFLQVSESGAAVNFSQSITITINSLNPTGANNWYISLWSGAAANNSINWVFTNMDLKIQPTDIDSSVTNLVYINNLFGELSIEKWWKSIMTKFNLVVIPNKDDGTQLIIEPYNDFVDTGESKDWSDKIDYTKDVQIIPPTKYCGKQVKFKDSQSNDYIYQSIKRNPFNDDERTYGEYIEPGVKNKFSDKDTIFTSIFVPTINYPLNGSTNNLGVYSCAVWNTNADGVKENTGGVRLSFFHGTKTLVGGFVYNLSGGQTFSGVANQKSKYPFFSAYSQKDFTDGSNVFTLNWAETLTNPPQDWDALPSFGMARKFWKDYILDNFNVNSRMLLANIRLSPKDIADFSFADTIELMGQNYRVNSIKGYPVSSSGNAKLELLLVNKSNFVPTTLINSTGGIITGDNQIECDWIYHSQAPNTGLLSFTTSLSSTPTTSIPQDCCQSMGYTWQQAPINQGGQYYCYMTVFPDLPEEETSELRSGAGNIKSNRTNSIIGTNNTTGGNQNSITGNENKIYKNAFNNKIEGNGNTIGRTVRNSFIYGSNNNLDTYQFSDVIFGEPLAYNTSIIGGRLSGDYGKLQITGDNVISNGAVSNTVKQGSKQKGDFILNLEYDESVDTGTTFIGQYGRFVLSSPSYNSIGNQNGIRFAGKTNVKITIEAVGISSSATNQTYKEKALITQTVMLSNYTSPVVIYSNTDSSVIDSIFGTTTIQVVPLSKPPYYDSQGGGFVCIRLDTAGRIDSTWTFNVKYETTPLLDLTSGAVLNPTVISGCNLWLDASNFTSLNLSGTSVVEWKDISGGNNHILQASSVYRPIYKEDNWHRPYIDFDGTSANLNNADADLLSMAQSNNTFIAIYKSDVSTAENYGQVIMGINDSSSIQRIGLRINASSLGGGGSNSVAYSSQSSFGNANSCNISSAGVTDLSIAIGKRTGTAIKLFDGNGNTDTATTGANDTSVNRFTVGGSSPSGVSDFNEFNGRIHELICYNKALSDAEVQKVISYLKNKWDLV